MSIFNNNDTTTSGTKTNSLISLITALLSLLSLALYFVMGTSMLPIPVLLWFLSFTQMQKGLNSDEPKYARVAKIILIIAAILLVLLCILVLVTFVRNFFLKTP